MYIKLLVGGGAGLKQTGMNNRVIEENANWMMILLSKTFLACVADVIKPWLTRSLVSSVAQAVELSSHEKFM